MTSKPQLPTANTAQTQLAHHLSAPRLAPFLVESAGHVKNALHLYAWNVRLSGAVHEMLHGFEVILRNAMDEQLCAWNATQRDPATGALRSRDWLMDPAPLLVRLTRGDIEKAKRFATGAVRLRANSQVMHADVVAQLSLGTWRFLLPDSDPGRQALWSGSLRAAFPQLRGTPASLTAQVAGIYKLRNRVAHLEPLLDTGNIARQVRAVAQVLGAISGPATAWVMSQQRVTAGIAQRPIVLDSTGQPV